MDVAPLIREVEDFYLGFRDRLRQRRPRRIATLTRSHSTSRRPSLATV